MVERYSGPTETLEDLTRGIRLNWSDGVSRLPFRQSFLIVKTARGIADTRYLGVFDGSRLAAAARILAPVEDVPIHHVQKIAVDEQYRSHRVARRLIEFQVASSRLPLASDTVHTPGGEAIWRSMLLREPKLQFALWSPHAATEPLTAADGHIKPDPWADRDTRLLAFPFNYCIGMV